MISETLDTEEFVTYFLQFCDNASLRAFRAVSRKFKGMAETVLKQRALESLPLGSAHIWEVNSKDNTLNRVQTTIQQGFCMKKKDKNGHSTLATTSNPEEGLLKHVVLSASDLGQGRKFRGPSLDKAFLLEDIEQALCSYKHCCIQMINEDLVNETSTQNVSIHISKFRKVRDISKALKRLGLVSSKYGGANKYFCQETATFLDLYWNAQPGSLKMASGDCTYTSRMDGSLSKDHVHIQACLFLTANSKQPVVLLKAHRSTDPPRENVRAHRRDPRR